jgi:putative component of toxin-antitoxin plasmid stabilization module
MFAINKTDEFQAWLEQLTDRLGKAITLAGGSKATQARDIRKAERILGELEIDDGKD